MKKQMGTGARPTMLTEQLTEFDSLQLYDRQER
jgi:hypothetical protein